MIYPIYVYGTSVLRKKAKEITKDYPKFHELIKDMFETMHASDGVGLAAPQIGLSVRMIVIDGTEIEQDKDDPPEDFSTFKLTLINPVIRKLWGEKWVYNEGCLSLPTLREDIERPEYLRIQYYDENFEFHDEEFNGIKSRIIQHEYDHLEGVLFIDRINPLKKRLINGKLIAISKGKVDIEYKIKIAKK